MTRTAPLQYLWWLVSDASGIVALVLVSASVLLGLAMASKALGGPRRRRAGARLHEHMALTALAAVSVHGLALLGDQWLKPGWRGIIVPFALSYRPAFTGAGIVAGYLAALTAPTFYLRRRIGVRRWRALHRATVLVWLLSVVHALGAGSDASKLWLRAVVLAPIAPVAYLLVLRIFGARGGDARKIARQVDPKGGAATGHGFGVDPTAVRLDDGAGDRQAEAGASLVSRAARVEPVEALEDPVELVRGYARPRVADLDLEASVQSAS
jgi:sulfoxide reductase heme-binding subunit YedZ